MILWSHLGALLPRKRANDGNLTDRQRRHMHSSKHLMEVREREREWVRELKGNLAASNVDSK